MQNCTREFSIGYWFCLGWIHDSSGELFAATTANVIITIAAIAKIIGQTSGGGECAFESTYLPSEKAIQYSSNTILYNYDGGQVVRGVELGAKPDIEVPFYQFYDIDTLEVLITK